MANEKHSQFIIDLRSLLLLKLNTLFIMFIDTIVHVRINTYNLYKNIVRRLNLT